MKNLKVGLVVDNPDRDLEGMTLVAAYLACKGFSSFLIPMYKQRHVVRSEGIDVIVLNYLRPNNLDTFLEYKRNGIKVAVLDTEGIAGRDFEEFADLFFETNMTDLIDLYMFWGNGQLQAVEKRSAPQPKKKTVTGCPRYDFFSEVWTKSIDIGDFGSSYILFNTNFPIVNPRFSSGKDDEYKTLLRVGYDPKEAKDLVDQNMYAFLEIKKLVKSVATSLPDENFILRPHPFESIKGYSDLYEYPNVKVIQEGSSNAWIYQAKSLVHLNCTTAIEAALMGKKVLTPSWLNKNAIYRDMPTQISQKIMNEDELLSALIGEEADYNDENIKKTQKFIQESFHLIDGKSSKRVANAVISLFDTPFYGAKILETSIKALIKNIFLNISEKPFLWQLREKYKKMNKSKYFTSLEVLSILNRITKSDPSFSGLSIQDVRRSKIRNDYFSDITAVKLND